MLYSSIQNSIFVTIALRYDRNYYGKIRYRIELYVIHFGVENIESSETLTLSNLSIWSTILMFDLTV